MANPLVGIIMGSKTDLETLTSAIEMLNDFGIPYEVRVVSAHRTPDWCWSGPPPPSSAGWRCSSPAAGGAAHLPGMVAAKTCCRSWACRSPPPRSGGADALLSIVQMPKGIPVGTLAIGKPGAGNAALLAIAILAGKRPELRDKLRAWRKGRAEEVLKADKSVQRVVEP